MKSSSSRSRSPRSSRSGSSWASSRTRPSPVAGWRGPALAETIGRLLAREGGHRDASAELTALYEPAGLAAGAVLLVGLGPRARFDAGAAFSAGVAAAEAAGGQGSRERSPSSLPDAEDPAAMASAMVEGAGRRHPQPGPAQDRAQSSPVRHARPGRAAGAGPKPPSRSRPALRRGEIVGAGGQPGARPGQHASGREVADQAGRPHPTRRRRTPGSSVDVWDAERIEHERFGGLLGVAAGSRRAAALRRPRLPAGRRVAHAGPGRQGGDVRLGRPQPQAERLDGGHEDRHDRRGRRRRGDAGRRPARACRSIVTGYLALTENMTGGRAMKLGDVLTIRNGKTVEVLNTDAEGRLILADALSFAVEKKPDRAPRPGDADRRLHGRAGDQGRRASSATTTRSARISSPPAGRPANAPGGCRSTTITRRRSRARSPT